MGFLDFLKKNPAAPTPPPPRSSPTSSPDLEWPSELSGGPTPPPSGDIPMAAPSMPSLPSQLSGPVITPFKPKLDDEPVTASANVSSPDLWAPPSAASRPPASSAPTSAPAPQSTLLSKDPFLQDQTVKKHVAAHELPDFNDEDLSVFDVDGADTSTAPSAATTEPAGSMNSSPSQPSPWTQSTDDAAAVLSANAATKSAIAARFDALMSSPAMPGTQAQDALVSSGSSPSPAVASSELRQSFVQSSPAQAASWSAMSLPDIPERDVPSRVKIVDEQPFAAMPANAVALQPDNIILPVGESMRSSELEATRFISSAAYLSYSSDTRSVRRVLRTSDDTIKEAMLRHEQLDAQYKRVASDVNAIQEQFIRIDASLFEEVQ